MCRARFICFCVLTGGGSMPGPLDGLTISSAPTPASSNDGYRRSAPTPCGRSDLRVGRSSAAIREILAETHAGFWGEAIFPVEWDRVEAGCSIESEGGGLPNSGFED